MRISRTCFPIVFALSGFLLLLAACSADLRKTCEVWPTQTEARSIEAGEASTYVAEMAAFLNDVVPRIRTATKASDRTAVANAQKEICRFNARWPTKAQKNLSMSKPYVWCFFATEYAYYLGSTLDFTPAGGLSYDELVVGYSDKCRSQLQAAPLGVQVK